MSNTYSNTELFSLTTQSVAKAMTAAGASGLEWSVLIALMHHKVSDNGEIGVNNGYVMSSTDVAEYLDMKRDDAARRAIRGLRKKGIIEVSRRVKRGSTWLTVYKLAIGNKCDECDAIRSDDTHEITRGEIAPHEGRNCPQRGAKLPLPPISTQEEGPTKDQPFGLPPEKEILINTTTENRSAFQHARSENCNEKIENDRFVTPRYPYPQSAEEVIEYAKCHWEEPGMEDLATLLVTEQPAIDFFNSNSKKNWTLPDGQRIYDWHSMLLGLGKRIMRDSERQGERFRRRTALTRESAKAPRRIDSVASQAHRR